VLEALHDYHMMPAAARMSSVAFAILTTPPDQDTVRLNPLPSTLNHQPSTLNPQLREREGERVCMRKRENDYHMMPAEVLSSLRRLTRTRCTPPEFGVAV